MTTLQTHAPGTFCWAALGTSDAEDAGRFYVDLFGWLPITQVIHGTPSATMVQEGLPICATFAMSDELRRAGFPPNWLPYLTVSSADESAARVEPAGGKLIEPPFEVPFAGRMAPVADSTGAGLSIWQAAGFAGAGAWDVNHALCWFELFTSNIDRAAAFYRSAFGWEVLSLGERPVFSVAGRHVAGLRPLGEGASRPAFWRTHFRVPSCDAAVDKALRLGGSLLQRPETVPELGRCAVLADRQHAEFAVLERMALARAGN